MTKGQSVDENAEDSEPGVVAKANATASRGPLAALLNPSAELAGEELRSWFEHRFFAKRRENLKSHIDAVGRTSEQIDSAIDAKNAPLIEDWASNAQNYDSNDPESTFYRALLIRILENKDDRNDTQRQLKILQKSDLDLFLDKPDNPTISDVQRIEYLVSNGLVVKQNIINPAGTMSMILVSALSFISFLAGYIDGYTESGRASFVDALLSVPAGSVIGGAIFLVTFALFLEFFKNKYRLFRQFQIYIVDTSSVFYHRYYFCSSSFVNLLNSYSEILNRKSDISQNSK